MVQWEKPTQTAVAAPAPQVLPPDIARLVQGGAQITAVYDPNAAAGGARPVQVQQPQQIMMASAGHHSASHAPQQIVYASAAPQPVIAPGQRVVYAPHPSNPQQPQMIMMAPQQQPMQMQPQPIQVFRTADGRYVDASGRIVNL